MPPALKRGAVSSSHRNISNFVPEYMALTSITALIFNQRHEKLKRRTQKVN